MLALLAASGVKTEILRAAAIDLENDRNPLVQRAAKVRLGSESLPAQDLPVAILNQRPKQLIALGFKGFDALHSASAEALKADALATCDDRAATTGELGRRRALRDNSR